MQVPVGGWAQSLEDAVRSLVNDHNISVVVASGNSGVDSCYVVPANVPETICVAASDLPSKFNTTHFNDPETLYQWSNTGQCVDVFAPGVDIYAACGGASKRTTPSCNLLIRNCSVSHRIDKMKPAWFSSSLYQAYDQAGLGLHRKLPKTKLQMYDRRFVLCAQYPYPIACWHRMACIVWAFVSGGRRGSS